MNGECIDVPVTCTIITWLSIGTVVVVIFLQKTADDGSRPLGPSSVQCDCCCCLIDYDKRVLFFCLVKLINKLLFYDMSVWVYMLTMSDDIVTFAVNCYYRVFFYLKKEIVGSSLCSRKMLTWSAFQYIHHCHVAADVESARSAHVDSPLAQYQVHLVIVVPHSTVSW